MLIDIHQHVYWEGYDPERLKSTLEKIGVKKCWVLSWESLDGGLEPGYLHLSVESCFAAAKQFPKLFIPFSGYDPRRNDAETLLKVAARRGGQRDTEKSKSNAFMTLRNL